jgi:hypothetical protein
MARLRTAHTAYQATSSLGQENGSPTWAAPAGPHIVSCPSSSNGHARNPVEQNQRRRPRLNPSVHFPSPSLSSTHAATSERPRLSADKRPSARRGNRHVASSWAPHRRARSPLGGRAIVEWPHGGISPRVRSPMRWRVLAPSWSPRCARIHKRCTGKILSLTTHRLAVVWVLPARRADPRPAVVHEVKTSN